MPTPGLVSDAERYLNLATYRRDGRAVETPVWFAESEGSLFVFTAGDAGKVKRLRNSARSRIAACDMRGGIQGPWLDTSTVLVDDPDTVERAYAALRAKYGIQMWLADLGSRLTGRYGRRAMLRVDAAG